MQLSQSRLKSESGLYNVPLTHSLKAAVDGYWLPDGTVRRSRRGQHLHCPAGYAPGGKGAWGVRSPDEAADARLPDQGHFRTQCPGLRAASEVGGYFMPVPGVSTVVSNFAEGNLCIECAMRDVKTGRLLMAFKDSNRAKARLYSANAYKRAGAADANLQLWANKMGELLTVGGEYRAQGKTMKDFINERSYAKGIYQRRTAY